MSLTVAAMALASVLALNPPLSLSVSSPNPVAGSPVTFTLHTTEVEPLAMDFGDGSARQPIRNAVPVAHIYANAGTYSAIVYTSNNRLLVGLTVTVQPKPSVQHVQATSLSWPTGAGSLALVPGSHVPQPVALVRVDAPGTVVLQWLLDGAPVTNATQSVSAAGVTTFTLSSALPQTGNHTISVRVLSPAPPAFGGPQPASPISYSFSASTTLIPVVSHVFYNGPPPKVKILPITAHTTFVEGTIIQDEPKYGKQEEFEGGPIIDYGIPLIDDNTAFQWHEPNPGTADYFEFRIYDGAGQRILARVRVSAAVYVPNAAFMQQILALLRQTVARRAEARWSGGSGKRGGRTTARHYQGLNFQPSFSWQVAGYKHFTQGGNVDLEVEKSGFWPLGMPDKPNGLSAMCPSEPFEEGSTSLNPDDLANKANGNNGTVVADYPGDDIALGGTIDLSRSPYHAQVTGVHPQPTPTPQGQQYGSFSNPVIENDFDNVYVDWGDGHVAPLHAGASENQDPYVQRPTSREGANSLRLPLPTEQPLTDHTYDWPGQYNVRVFQLGESDAQGANPTSVADAALPSQYHLAMPALHFASAQSGPNYAAIAGRAYMVYCHQVTIDPVEDTVATGPLHLIKVPVTSFPGHDPKQTATVALPAQASTCDDSLQAEATLTYYGSGFAKVTWRLDNVPIGSPEIIGRLSSPQRTGLKGNDPAKWAQQQAVITNTYVIHSPELSTKALGLHHVTVQVTTAPDPTSPNLSSAVANMVGSRMSESSFSSSSVSSTSSASTVSASNMRLGVLSASTAQQQFGVVNLAPKVVLLAIQEGQPGITGFGFYNVAAADPAQPCKFAFPTTSGTFEIGGLQGHVHKQGSTYSGSGTLELYINSSATKADLFDVPVQFNNWTSADGANITAGTLDVSPSSYSVNAPGVAATIRRLKATATSTPMDLTMDVGFADQTLRIPGGTARPSWNGLSEPVDPSGNWYAGSLTLPAIEIGWTRFEVSSNSMAIDLSHTQGQPGAGACGDTGDKTWVGVDLGNASVAPYTMDLVQNGGVNIPVKNWVVDAGGLCVANMNAHINFSSKLGEGTVNIPSVSVSASDGNFNADYPGMSVDVPWIGATLSGDAKLIETGTQTGAITFALSSPNVTKQFGPVRVTASNLQLTEVGGLGWTVSGSGLFHFDTGSAAFTDVPVPNMYFTFAGRPAFAGGATTLDVPLSGSTFMGKTPLDLQSVHLSGATSGNDRLGVAFSTVAHLSAALPASNVQVNYDVTDTGGSGPVTSPFTTEAAFPAGNPVIDANIAPAYDPSSGANTRYYGKVDLAMLGGPPVSAEFLLGYQGSSDYWLTRASIPLSPAGVPLVPAIMNLYSIQGGLGYHMDLSAFQDTNSIQNAPVNLGNDMLFMAGMQVGSPDDGFAYTFNGNFSVVTGNNAGARMDYTAWVLTPEHNPSTATLQGFFQYAGGNFDGKTWGGFTLLPNVVYASLGNNANNAAVNIHFGGGHWHIYAGQKNGPKITVHVIVTDADGYVMVGDDGFSVGAGESIDLEVGDSSVVSAYIRGNMDVDLTITPQPHVSGDFDANASVGACVVGWCGGASATANVHAEAVPVDVHAHATLSPPWPIPDISVDVHL
jgi:hypothetical protein